MEDIERIADLDSNELQGLWPEGVWIEHKADDRFYSTLHPKQAPDLSVDWDGKVVQWFYLKLPPGGYLHKHVDRRKPNHVTYHIPICSNSNCRTFIAGQDFQMPVGGMYRMVRDKEHYAVNKGATDRIHLLVEVDHS